MNNSKYRAGSIAYKTRRFLCNPLVLKIMKNKAMIISIIYMLSPIDIIPDAIPVVGNLDDLLLLLSSLANVLESYSNGNLIVDTVTTEVSNIKSNVSISGNVSKVVSRIPTSKGIVEAKDGVVMCPHCGTAVIYGSRFCIECGKEL